MRTYQTAGDRFASMSFLGRTPALRLWGGRMCGLLRSLLPLRRRRGRSWLRFTRRLNGPCRI